MTILAGAWSEEDCRGLAQEVSKENSISNWTGDYSSDIWAKNEVAFCFCPKNLSEAKLKGNELILFGEVDFQTASHCLCLVVISNHSYAALQ